MKKVHLLIRETTFKHPLAEIFEFFSKAENLDRLTPPYLKFKIMSQLPIQMAPGVLIHYKLKLFGIPFSWTTKITRWEPPFLFEDTQISGPYRVWIHEHRFEEINGEVRMHDTVRYLSPGWLLEPFIHAFFVKRNVEQIFAYREKVLNELFS